MKYLRLSIIFVLSLLASQVFGQQLALPSPNASVSLTAGVTKIDISYSSPGVKGRTIWGDLVPYDVAWRAGANSATTITFSNDVSFENGKTTTTIPAGSYSIFMMPTKTGDWTVHISKGNSVFGYQKDGKQDIKALEADDLLSFNVKGEAQSSSQDRLAYYITATNENDATVTMHWEKVKVSFLIKTDIIEGSVKNIKEATAKFNGAWYSLAASAQFYEQNGQDLKEASKWADMSIGLRGDHFFAHWVKANILAKQGKKSEALTEAKKAKELGEATGGGFYTGNKAEVEKALTDWK